MTATSAYQAGIEANAVQWSYGIEAVWGQAPATQYQAIRYTSETMSGTKTRTRPQEINLAREAAAFTTTQEASTGAINIALSFGTYDDMLSVLLGNDWQAAQALAGVGGDITITTGTNILSSTTAGKFTNIAAGQYIRLFGWTNAANNGIFKVVTKTSATSLTLAPMGGAFVTETPAGTAVQIRASTIKNGSQFKSLNMQKMLSSTKWFQYPGAYMSGFSLTGGVGNFLSGSFNIISQQELPATADASTGGILPAPSGRVHDPVGTFGGWFWNETPLAATPDSFTLPIANTGAAAEYGMGSAKAVGILAGMLEISGGKLKMFFKDMTYYTIFKAETLGTLTMITKDPAGNAYVIQVLAAELTNPTINATAPNGAVYAEFTVAGNPVAGGGTVQMCRLPAV